MRCIILLFVLEKFIDGTTYDIAVYWALFNKFNSFRIASFILSVTPLDSYQKKNLSRESNLSMWHNAHSNALNEKSIR